MNLDLPDITRAALADLVQALDGGLDKRRPRPFYRQLRGKRLVDDGQAARRTPVHAGQVRLSRRPGRAGGPADGRGDRARSSRRGETNARVRRPSPHFARAVALAAIRETFEETGLAIGVLNPGAANNPPPGAWSKFAATGVTPALEAIDFLARAITPPGRPALRRALSHR